jgi:hypothetical protein
LQKLLSSSLGPKDSTGGHLAGGSGGLGRRRLEWLGARVKLGIRRGDEGVTMECSPRAENDGAGRNWRSTAPASADLQLGPAAQEVQGGAQACRGGAGDLGRARGRLLPLYGGARGRRTHA